LEDLIQEKLSPKIIKPRTKGSVISFNNKIKLKEEELELLK